MSVIVKNLDSRPDEVREFPLGRFEVVTVQGRTLGRAVYEPGWKWSEHVGRAQGQRFCPVEHVVLVVRGRAAVQMEGGAEFVMQPGDLCYVPPGHDSWVVGDEQYVSLHFEGAEAYGV